jgi:hypothetical protein
MRRARRSSSSGEIRATSPPSSAATTFSVDPSKKDEMAKRGTAGDVARDSRGLDIAQAVLFVADVSFFFEDAELRADGGITGLVGELSEDLADRGAFEHVENVHNLSFAAGESVCFGSSEHMLFF